MKKCLEAVEKRVHWVLMANVTNSTLGLARPASIQNRRGFSLVEMLCVIAIVSLLASVSWPSIVGVVSGDRLTNNAYELDGLIQQARNTAITDHTYVWLGFNNFSQSGAPSLLVAGIMSNSGLATDPQSSGMSNFQPVFKPVILRGVSLATAQNYAALPGLLAPNTDAGSQSYSFQMNALGTPNAQFTDVIAFGPDGQAYLPSSAGALGNAPVQCVGVGLNNAPVSANHLHTVAVQVHGLSGQVSVFQQ
jgi:prepilin-type N-terminal cleavage/methylation domain-containing protein